MDLVHDIFLESLTFKLQKKCVMDIINVFGNKLKNAEHGHLSIIARVQIKVLFYFILCYYFEVVVHGIGA